MGRCWSNSSVTWQAASQSLSLSWSQGGCRQFVLVEAGGERDREECTWKARGFPQDPRPRLLRSQMLPPLAAREVSEWARCSELRSEKLREVSGGTCGRRVPPYLEGLFARRRSRSPLSLCVRCCVRHCTRHCGGNFEDCSDPALWTIVI